MNAGFVLRKGRIATMDVAGDWTQALAVFGGGSPPSARIRPSATISAWLRACPTSNVAAPDTEILACDPAAIRTTRVVATAAGWVERSRVWSRRQ